MWRLLRETGREWRRDKASRLAAAVSFYSILSLAPLLVIAVAIAGMVFGEAAARKELVRQISGYVGHAGAEVVETALASAQRSRTSAWASILGVGLLLFGASGVFRELHGAMNVIWDVQPRPGRSVYRFLRDKLLSFAMVLSVGFLLLASLVLNTMLTALGGYADEFVAHLPQWIAATSRVLNFLLVTVLFALVFRYLPDVRTPWRDVWFGGAATAMLFTLGNFLIGLYLVKAAVGSPFGAAGSLVAFVVWVYYSASIVFFGAELTQVRARQAGRTLELTTWAQWMPGESPDEALARITTGKVLHSSQP